jgi:hypothetical protein
MKRDAGSFVSSATLQFKKRGASRFWWLTEKVERTGEGSGTIAPLRSVGWPAELKK